MRRLTLASSTDRRDASIQSLRALALLLMVAGHVIGDTPDRGLQAGEGTVLRELYLLLDDVRMPFFTVLSGYVYAMRPVRPGTVGRFLRGKVRRLLVPMVVVGLLFMAVQFVVPATNQTPDPLTDLVMLLFVGYEHLWFLQAIFLVFAVVALLDLRGAMSRPSGWAAVLAGAGLLYVALHVPTPWALFSVNQAMHLLPFFLIGLGLRRFSHLAPTGAWAVLVAAVVTIGLIAVDVVLRHEGLSPHGPPARALRLAVGAAGVVMLYGIRQIVHCRPLAWLGGFAFGVYLLHVFGAAGSRIVLERLGVDSTALLFTAGLVAGVAFPVAVQLTAGRLPLVALLLFGERPRRTTTPEVSAMASEEVAQHTEPAGRSEPSGAGSSDVRTAGARRRRDRAARRSRV